MIAGLKNLANHPLTGSFPLPALYMLIKHAKFESVNENDTLFQENQPITDCLVFIDAPIQNQQAVLNEELFYRKEIKFSQRKVDCANRFYRDKPGKYRRGSPTLSASRNKDAGTKI